MNAQTVCRAKNKNRCWKHGTELGIIANEKTLKIISLHADGLIPDIQPDFIKNKSLKTLNAPVLAYAISSYATNTPHIDEKKISQALLMASELHKNQSRANRGLHDRTPYVEHPYRNALRSIRFNSDSTEQIVGSILHDTVEDSPFEFSEKYTGKKAATEEEARENSLRYIQNNFGTRAEKIVRGVSNPIIDTKGWTVEQKNKLYYDHVAESIVDSDVFVVKVCDFIDNAGSLHHNVGKGLNPTGIQRRSSKYLPVANLLQERLTSNTNPIQLSPEDKTKMYSQLENIKTRLTRLAKNDAS